jgi:hypothetical protein
VHACSPLPPSSEDGQSPLGVCVSQPRAQLWLGTQVFPPPLCGSRVATSDACRSRAKEGGAASTARLPPRRGGVYEQGALARARPVLRCWTPTPLSFPELIARSPLLTLQSLSTYMDLECTLWHTAFEQVFRSTLRVAPFMSACTLSALFLFLCGSCACFDLVPHTGSTPPPTCVTPFLQRVLTRSHLVPAPLAAPVHILSTLSTP